MGSMDSSAGKRPPPPPQAAGEPPAAPPEGEGGGRVQGKLSGKQLRTLAAILLVSDYVKVVGRTIGEYDVETPGAPLPWRLPAGVALAYAAAAALIWFFRLHDVHDRDDAARWGGKATKQAAHVLVYAIVFVLAFFSASMMPCALYMFVWVGSRDHVYLGLEVHKEESDEKQYEA